MWLQLIVCALFFTLSEASREIGKWNMNQRDMASSARASDLSGETSLDIVSESKDSRFSHTQAIHTRVKRDDVAFLVPENEQEQRERIYSELDSKELGISPEDRLLRVACAFLLTGVDKGNWGSKWAEEYERTPVAGKTLSRRLVDFATRARFGPTPAPPTTYWILKFDAAYRYEHDLPADDHEEILYTTTRGPAFLGVLSSYSSSIRLSSRLKHDPKWTLYTEPRSLPATQF